jgi:hypothetical protein
VLQFTTAQAFINTIAEQNFDQFNGFVESALRAGKSDVRFFQAELDFLVVHSVLI